MPTGHTAAIYEGKDVSFPQFAMECARSFGALIPMRDEPMDAPIREFQPSIEYENKKLEGAYLRQVEALGWTEEEAERAALDSYHEAFKAWQDVEQKNLELSERYNAMMREVEKWIPPTPEHERLQSFMLEQLSESKRYDCGSYPQPKALSGAEFRKLQLSKAQKDIAYYSKAIDDEIARTAERNEWVKALMESLK